MDVKERIHRNLKIACAEQDWNLTRVAEASGMSRQALNQRLKGVTGIRLSELMKWAEVLDVPLSKLLNGVGGIQHHENGEGAYAR